MPKIIRKEMVFLGSRDVERSVVLCDCGEEVMCLRNTNTCECGADYNMSGARLASRSRWGEETGETPEEVLTGMDQESDVDVDFNW